MSYYILDGKHCADTQLKHLKKTIENSPTVKRPGLAVIQVGNHSASNIYVNNKRRACQKVGIQTFDYDLKESTTEQALINQVQTLNSHEDVHGILIQLPLPSHINEQNILETIKPEKDVDGFHPYNIGRLAQKKPTLQPCTPLGIKMLLDFYGLKLDGLHTVIVGASNIVGRPAALNCLLANATVTVCHKATTNLAWHVQNADCLIVAIGNPNVIQASWIKSGAIIIDVGINRTENGGIIGDVPFKAASARAEWITPVPGGVGPMTVAALMHNTWQAFQQQLQR